MVSKVLLVNKPRKKAVRHRRKAKKYGISMAGKRHRPHLVRINRRRHVRHARRNPPMTVKGFFGQIGMDDVLGVVGGVAVAGVVTPMLLNKFVPNKPSWWNPWVEDGISVLATLGGGFVINKFAHKPQVAKAFVIGGVATVVARIIAREVLPRIQAGTSGMGRIGNQEILLPTAIGDADII